MALITKKQKLIKDLEKLKEDESDIAGNHLKADELLLKFIGDKKVKGAFDCLDKWYE